MKIRTALASDVQSIADIHTTSWRDTYGKALTAHYLSDIVPKERHEVWKRRLDAPKSNQYVAVAEQDGHIVGFACAYSGENSKWGSYLDNLHVRKAHQSKKYWKIAFDRSVPLILPAGARRRFVLVGKPR